MSSPEDRRSKVEAIPPAERPLPVPDGDTKPFWDAARQHRLLLQQCDDCASFVFYPRSLCPSCGSDQLTWREAVGRGMVYSFTIVHRAPPGFAADVPYVIALVDLEEGVRMMCTIDGPPFEISIGAPVHVIFDDVTLEISLPRFRLDHT